MASNDWEERSKKRWERIVDLSRRTGRDDLAGAEFELRDAFRRRSIAQWGDGEGLLELREQVMALLDRHPRLKSYSVILGLDYFLLVTMTSDLTDEGWEELVEEIISHKEEKERIRAS